MRRGDPKASGLVSDLAGKAAFDKLRRRAATLSDHIAAVRDDLKGQRHAAILFCFIATIAAAVLTLGSKYVLWRGLRRQVLAPIDDLGSQTREVARGAIAKQIRPSGPPEIAALGRDVDSMRARIASELARVERARIGLLERGEDLARSNADLEQFAYVASHDLSEPLRKVANFCQLLERQYSEELDDKAKQYIAFAVDGAKRMQVLIADLLSFSRVGRTTENFAAVDTGIALSRALVTLEDRIAASDAQIIRGALPTVDGDATLLTALFQNLVGNALKYRDPDHPPRIEISAVRAGSNWQFTVADNGIGIDRQYAERIFTIFQRLHLRDKYGGTGIGLALCRKIVEFHRGKIWLAESDRSRCYVCVLAPGAFPSAIRLQRGPCRDGGRRMSTEPMHIHERPLTVLLVEDDPGDVLIAREAMAAGQLDTTLEVVTDGVEAIAYLRRENGYKDARRPDLILLDLNLPRMSGHEVLAEVKKDPALRRIPVVVLTTSQAHEDIARSYELHASVHVSKPVDFDDFAGVVKQIDDFFGRLAELPND